MNVVFYPVSKFCEIFFVFCHSFSFLFISSNARSLTDLMCCLNSLQTITRVPLISSNAATIAASLNAGFVMEQMTVATMRMRPTLHARVCTVLNHINVVLDSV